MVGLDGVGGLDAEGLRQIGALFMLRLGFALLRPVQCSAAQTIPSSSHGLIFLVLQISFLTYEIGVERATAHISLGRGLGALYLASQYRGVPSIERCSSPVCNASAKASVANHLRGTKWNDARRNEGVDT